MQLFANFDVPENIPVIPFRSERHYFVDSRFAEIKVSLAYLCHCHTFEFILATGGHHGLSPAHRNLSYPLRYSGRTFQLHGIHGSEPT